MKKILNRILPVLLTALMIIPAGLIPVSSAEAYTNSQGSVKLVCGSFKKTYKVKNYKNNFSYMLNTVLNKARIKAAKANKKARVTVTKGNYQLDRTILLYSNTILDARNCKFRYYGNLLRNGFDGKAVSGYGYTSAKNITIKGGEWEQLIDFKYASIDSAYYMHSTFRFAHCTNLVVKEAQFKNNYNCHDIEIAGVKKARITKNEFYNDKSVSGIAYEGGRESVQIDVCTAEAMPQYPSYDKTACENIGVYNNTFTNKFRAIGSHHAVLGTTFKNISVHNNDMFNIAGVAVYAVYWTNSSIYSNYFGDVGIGIEMRSMKNSDNYNFYNLNGLSYQESEDAVSGSVNYIYDNIIKVRTNDNLSEKPTGVRVLGDYYDSDDSKTGIKAGTYNIHNVFVGVAPGGSASPNYISGNLSAGIQMNYGVNSTIKYNRVDLAYSMVDSTNGIEIKGSGNSVIEENIVINGKTSRAKGILLSEATSPVLNNNITVNNNKIGNFYYSGIYVQNSLSSTITNNSVENCSNYSLTVNSSSLTSVRNNIFKSDKYGLYVLGGADNTTASQNYIIGGKIGLCLSDTHIINVEGNYFKGDDEAVLIKKSDSGVIKGNKIYSKKYGVCVDVDCTNNSITDNTIDSGDECVYYNGKTSADKLTEKSLVVTNNAVNCPADKAAVRVVYDNVSASIHSNYRSDGAEPRYRFKGDNQTSYRNAPKESDFRLENVTFEKLNGIYTISWNKLNEADGYRILLNGALLKDTDETTYRLESYNGGKLTVVPFKNFGNIKFLSVPVELSSAVEVTTPTDNTEPTQNTEPSDNTNPSEATTPSQATTPSNATEPSDTSAPTEPPAEATEASASEETTAPVQATEPSQTVAPTEATSPMQELNQDS